MPTPASIMANKIAWAIFIVGFVLSILILVTTFWQQTFLIQLIGEIEIPSEIRFVRSDGTVVICERANGSPEYVCRKAQ